MNAMTAPPFAGWINSWLITDGSASADYGEEPTLAEWPWCAAEMRAAGDDNDPCYPRALPDRRFATRRRVC